MTIEALTEIHLARPFVPDRLQLADGKEVGVTHPQCLTYHSLKPRTVGVALPNGGIKVIDLLLVAAIEVGDGRTKRTRRGRRHGS